MLQPDPLPRKIAPSDEICERGTAYRLRVVVACTRSLADASSKIRLGSSTACFLATLLCMDKLRL